MKIINPMHNILLGVTKTQWFKIWIKGNALRESTEKTPRELDAIHTYLKAFEMPSWVARLPNKVGYPAGGSLTSDKWKAMLLLYCPLVILDYGPVYSFWTYLFKRLNKILKSYSVNNHDGRELEVTFYHKFTCEVRLRGLLNVISTTKQTKGLSKEDQLNINAARMILKTDMNKRGTVAALGQEIAEAAQECE
ncbi:hypothetical protein EW026_g7117 [Hermanssonia centrifuga]|uniref:Uncharacterized protein n=1 Tax=Hermanssonia centrifuga TaxID=98765 RepID=A0A4S4K8X7_9APHY|nr:hypothetical protein EW026_g7117 [Hermanssonia centrifuga]